MSTEERQLGKLARPQGYQALSCKTDIIGALERQWVSRRIQNHHRHRGSLKKSVPGFGPTVVAGARYIRSQQAIDGHFAFPA
jgi:hypothetical protein